jgi:hypothetical protein
MKLSTRRFASLFSLAAVASLVFACSASPSSSPAPASSGPTEQAQVVEHIDAKVMAAQPAGKSYVVDMTRADAAFDFDPASGPIDWSRVTLSFGGGHTVSMSDWLAQAAAEGGVDHAKENGGHIVLRPTQSYGDERFTQADDCVWLCAWVCSSESGPCVWVCVAACTGGRGHLPV